MIRKRIEEIGEVVGGATPSTSTTEFWDGEIPWLSPKDLTNHNSRYIKAGSRNITMDGLNSCSTKLLPKGTVLFSSRAPIGYIAIAKNPLCTNQGFKSIVPSPRVDSLFLYYLLEYNKKSIEGIGAGTTFREVSASTMRSIEVELPDSIEEQRKIASILDSIDSKIELNYRLNDYLEECAKTLFRRHCLDRSNLEKTTVRDFAQSMSNGATPSRKNDSFWIGGTNPWVKTGEVNNNLIFETEEYVTDLALEKTSIKLLPTDTVIMALYGSGTAGRVALLKAAATTNQACTAMVCDSPEKAFYLYLTLQDMYREIGNLARGSVQQNLSKDIVAELEIPLISQETFGRLGITEIYAQLSTNAFENIQLVKLRDALLPKLMSGEIDTSKVNLTQLNNHLSAG